ncbi:MAG: tRNA pseudouridine(38-40) synthase TruA [Phycisphaerales bacterium]|jgi:tRNA pseudouridine38-40 synthase|nr:tRNA pseudouridine(38-40) synthase TruA [Phycisphaerales bacterium]
MARYRLIVAYDGTEFHGWQKQTPTNGERLRTAQEVLEQAVVDVTRQPIRLHGASRTDAGVHAKGQVAVFDADSDIDPYRMLCAVNSKLPSDIRIHHADLVPFEFNPISDCISKGYRYTLAHGCKDPRRQPLFDRHFVATTIYELDVEAMQEASSLLVGELDFAAFTKINHGRETTIRRIDSCTVQEIKEWRIAIIVSGNGFLWNMVRIIVGTLVDVGRKKISVSDIPEIIASKDRRRTGTTMPPEGLSLEWINYREYQ